ncbi:unnamed protein product [Lactuca saligna]|uniref:Uncharacterized protein n=1 Tax=Lactuca saligna TaxID=75948 RepID=A0AA36E972_LACSI|nr:unnamed protein product [Lactuca saligna]
MKKLGVHDGVYHLFIKLGWRGFLRLCDRTYEEPTMEFLSTYARDDDTEVLTFQLKGEHHRLTYEELVSIMGFFLDKCDSIRQRSSGEIFIGGLITIIGRAVGLDFPDPEYIPVDTPPNLLLDCDTLIRMEMLLDRGTRTYSWLDADKAPVYILPSWIGSSFDTGDPDTWLPPDQLTQAGVFPEFGDDEGDAQRNKRKKMMKRTTRCPKLRTILTSPRCSSRCFSMISSRPLHNILTSRISRRDTKSHHISPPRSLTNLPQCSPRCGVSTPKRKRIREPS